MRARTPRLLLPLLLCLVAPPASGAVAVATSLEALAGASERVVVGVVERVEARTVDGGRRIFSFARVRVEETLKGERTPTLQLALPGGTVGEWGQKVAGVDLPAEGARVLLFLRARPVPAGEAPLFELTAYGMGLWAVEADTAWPLDAGVEWTASEQAPRPLPLSELRTRVGGEVTP